MWAHSAFKSVGIHIPPTVVAFFTGGDDIADLTAPYLHPIRPAMRPWDQVLPCRVPGIIAAIKDHRATAPVAKAPLFIIEPLKVDRITRHVPIVGDDKSAFKRKKIIDIR